jgi:preprotein translocase subunit SecF
MTWRHFSESCRGHRVPNMNIIGRRNLWFAISGFFIVLSLVGLAFRGLNFSIEFPSASISR